MHPLVTIAIPTYKRADSYLKQTLKSAFNQNYSNLEIIVSDNCSPDNTEEMVKSYANPRIRYFRQAQGLKPNDNFNFCLKQAKGDYFLLLQDDDLIDHDFVEVCLKAVNYKTDIGIIQSGTRWIDSNGNVLKELPNRACELSIEAFFRAFFAGKTGLYLCSTLFNTKRLREVGGFNSKHNLFQDVMAEVKLAAKHGRKDIYEIKASNRKHTSAMSSSVKVSNWCDDSLMLIDLMCELVSENKTIVRAEGMQALSGLNYRLTDEIKSPLRRFITYLIIFKKFNYKYFPPPVNNFLCRNPLYYGLRFIKRKIKPLLQRYPVRFLRKAKTE